MSPVFRPLTPDDLDAMLALEQAAHAHPWSRNVLADSFGNRYFTGSLWLQQQQAATEKSEQLLGYFIADGILDESTLMNICVAPEQQGQGFGRQLITHYLHLCERQHITQCWLEVRASNMAAQALYQACGYQENGRRRHYYQSAAGAEDAVLMALLLNK
ncbi:ribosomal-protein-alanine acetyltransferase [Oceanisphaera marina]|uniref:[Ribosomal protein bS18]-alanine N-acetyltransferase n=1 Tax=Oceanisphaera marina TaxID=2017550 RepID=A0ABQ1IRJ0_9GAMM|nr:ribosomal protein S18-alanine N-acetyltransferase [Oceanisphaera marina]GGB49326.1 ribosomal-protein-alanine acetyltransferase [Oceanisphaera marina]